MELGVEAGPDPVEEDVLDVLDVPAEVVLPATELDVELLGLAPDDVLADVLPP